jgi:mono/diheme cytochrome c family protein
MRDVLFVLAVLAACGKNEKPPPPSSNAPTAQETGPASGTRTASAGGSSQAQRIFQTVCATCHGTDGTGNGPGAQALNPKPRNYTDAAWQASVSDEDIKKIIVEGGAAVGKSPMMPANKHLAEQPEILDGLVQIIRGFGKTGTTGSK